jgi:DNA-binding transcriptional MerR regulator
MYKYMELIVTDRPADFQFPIRELVRRTGVHASTLRAWENRHGLLRPVRTPSGHRLYGLDDVRRVHRLQELLAQGLNLSEIVPLLDVELAPAEIPDATMPAAGESAALNPAWRGYLREILRALEDFSTERLDALYNEACSLYPIDLVTGNLLLPALEQLGARWEKRPSGIAEEHFFTAWLRNKLGARMHHVAGISRGRPLILACLPDEKHEIGLLVFALGALQRGYRVIYLGANMPLRQIMYVATQTRSAGIILAGRDVPDAAVVLADIEWLVKATPTPVFLGSHFADRFGEALNRMGAMVLGGDIAMGLDRLDARLSSRSRRGTGAAAPPITPDIFS